MMTIDFKGKVIFQMEVNSDEPVNGENDNRNNLIVESSLNTLLDENGNSKIITYKSIDTSDKKNIFENPHNAICKFNEEPIEKVTNKTSSKRIANSTYTTYQCKKRKEIDTDFINTWENSTVCAEKRTMNITNEINITSLNLSNYMEINKNVKHEMYHNILKNNLIDYDEKRKIDNDFYNFVKSKSFITDLIENNSNDEATNRDKIFYRSSLTYNQQIKKNNNTDKINRTTYEFDEIACDTLNNYLDTPLNKDAISEKSEKFIVEKDNDTTCLKCVDDVKEKSPNITPIKNITNTSLVLEKSVNSLKSSSSFDMKYDETNKVIAKNKSFKRTNDMFNKITHISLEVEPSVNIVVYDEMNEENSANSIPNDFPKNPKTVDNVVINLDEEEATINENCTRTDNNNGKSKKSLETHTSLKVKSMLETTKINNLTHESTIDINVYNDNENTKSTGENINEIIIQSDDEDIYFNSCNKTLDVGKSNVKHSVDSNINTQIKPPWHSKSGDNNLVTKDIQQSLLKVHATDKQGSTPFSISDSNITHDQSHVISTSVTKTNLRHFPRTKITPHRYIKRYSGKMSSMKKHIDSLESLNKDVPDEDSSKENTRDNSCTEVAKEHSSNTTATIDLNSNEDSSIMKWYNTFKELCENITFLMYEYYFYHKKIQGTNKISNRNDIKAIAAKQFLGAKDIYFNMSYPTIKQLILPYQSDDSAIKDFSFKMTKTICKETNVLPTAIVNPLFDVVYKYLISKSLQIGEISQPNQTINTYSNLERNDQQFSNQNNLNYNFHNYYPQTEMVVPSADNSHVIQSSTVHSPSQQPNHIQNPNFYQLNNLVQQNTLEPNISNLSNGMTNIQPNGSYNYQQQFIQYPQQGNNTIQQMPYNTHVLSSAMSPPQTKASGIPNRNRRGLSLLKSNQPHAKPVYMQNSGMAHSTSWTKDFIYPMPILRNHIDVPPVTNVQPSNPLYGNAQHANQLYYNNLTDRLNQRNGANS